VGRPKTPLLSRRRIAEAALELIDLEGLEGLTMRRLGRRLGVEGSSLYHHVASRDDLLDEITAGIAEQVDVTPRGDHADWRATLAEFARSYRRAFARHPAVIATIVRRPVRSRASLEGYDRVFALLLGAGWSGARASAIMAAVDYLVLGSALETFAAGFDRPPAEYAEDYPSLSRALSEADHASLDDRGFELGLETLVAGLGVPR
jgi:AcrR family transcriptional regulator